MAFVMKAGVSHAINVVSKKIKTFRIQVTPSKSSGKKDKTRGQICLPPPHRVLKCVTFLWLGKVFLLSTSKLLVRKLSWVKRFPGNNSFCKVNSPSDNSCVWFGLLRSFGSFRHDLGFSADAHRHQVSFGWSFMSSRLVWFMRPLSFGSSPLVCRLRSSITPSPSTPPCAPTVSGESSWYLYDVLCILISAYADRMLRRSAMNYKSSTTSLFIDAGLGATFGGN